jgi:hypothetical protein
MRGRRLAAWCALGGALLVAGSAPVAAQIWPPAAAAADTSTLRPEVRLDWFGGRAGAVHAGGGVSFRAGTYVRVGVNAGAGPSLADSVRNIAHGDLTARFMLDPFRQQRVGISLGGGVGARYEDDRVRAFALLFADAEAGRGRGWTPFIRAGLGGGLRVAAGLRRGTARFR